MWWSGQGTLYWMNLTVKEWWLGQVETSIREILFQENPTDSESWHLSLQDNDIKASHLPFPHTFIIFFLLFSFTNSICLFIELLCCFFDDEDDVEMSVWDWTEEYVVNLAPFHWMCRWICGGKIWRTRNSHWTKQRPIRWIFQRRTKTWNWSFLVCTWAEVVLRTMESWNSHLSHPRYSTSLQHVHISQTHNLTINFLYIHFELFLFFCWISSLTDSFFGIFFSNITALLEFDPWKMICERFPTPLLSFFYLNFFMFLFFQSFFSIHLTSFSLRNWCCLCSDIQKTCWTRTVYQKNRHIKKTKTRKIQNEDKFGQKTHPHSIQTFHSHRIEFWS